MSAARHARCLGVLHSLAKLRGDGYAPLLPRSPCADRRLDEAHIQPSGPGAGHARVDRLQHDPPEAGRIGRLREDERDRRRVPLAEGNAFYTTVEQFQRYYEQMENCDLAEDLFLVEVDAHLVGYIRVGWRDEPGTRLYEPIVFLDPDVVTASTFEAAFAIAERRMEEIAAGHPPGSKTARIDASSSLREAVLTRRGYMPVRVFYTMVRPNARRPA